MFLRYCTVVGDEVATTWEEARADLIVEGLPVRVPPTYRGQRSYPGLFWAATNDRTLVYESLLELDRLWLADVDPTVTRICTQPFQATGSDGTNARTHVPDLLFITDDGTVTVVDMKPHALVEKPLGHSSSGRVDSAAAKSGATRSSPVAAPSCCETSSSSPSVDGPEAARWVPVGGAGKV